MNEQLRDRFRGCLLGLTVGNALGATVEFINSTEIQQRFGVHRDIIGGGWLRLKPGEHTDDTDMTLCVAGSIVPCGRVEPADIAQRFVAWLATSPKDVGDGAAGRGPDCPWGHLARGRPTCLGATWRARCREWLAHAHRTCCALPCLAAR